MQLLLWQDEVSQPVFNGVALKCLLPCNSCCHSLAWSLLAGQLRGQSGRATGAPTASLRILPTNVRSKGQAHENYCLLFMNYFPEIGSLAESKCCLARIARALLTVCAHLGTPLHSFKVRRFSVFFFFFFCLCGISILFKQLSSCMLSPKTLSLPLHMLLILKCLPFLSFVCAADFKAYICTPGNLQETLSFWRK